MYEFASPTWFSIYEHTRKRIGSITGPRAPQQAVPRIAGTEVVPPSRALRDNDQVGGPVGTEKKPYETRTNDFLSLIGLMPVIFGRTSTTIATFPV